MLKAILFDLDGTLLPMNEQEFTKIYIDTLYENVRDLGYKKEELLKVIFKGLENMYKNDGSKTNEEVFWDTFKNYYGKEQIIHKPFFDKYYKSDFEKTLKACEKNKEARKIIDFVNENFEYCILSTNPILPKIATLKRLNYINLNEKDFSYITFFESSSFCKPNPMYFQNILNKFNLKPNEVILFGNNDYEDYWCAKQIGIKCYLVNNTPIFHQEIKKDYSLIEIEDIIPTIIKEKETL